MEQGAGELSKQFRFEDLQIWRFGAGLRKRRLRCLTSLTGWIRSACIVLRSNCEALPYPFRATLLKAQAVRRMPNSGNF